MEIRRDIELTNYQPPPWLTEYEGLKMNQKNPLYPSLVAEILDILKAAQWSIGRTAAMLGVSTAALTRLLYADHHLWGKINQFRAQLGLRPLIWER